MIAPYLWVVTYLQLCLFCIIQGVSLVEILYPLPVFRIWAGSQDPVCPIQSEIAGTRAIADVLIWVNPAP